MSTNIVPCVTKCYDISGAIQSDMHYNNLNVNCFDACGPITGSGSGSTTPSVFTILNNNIQQNLAVPGVAYTNDFVFGSSSSTIHQAGQNSRLIFDTSTGSLRAGVTTGTQWDIANRGANSVAFGFNNTTSAASSSVLGGTSNMIDVAGTNNAILAGSLNTIDVAVNNSSIISGASSTLPSTATNTSLTQRLWSWQGERKAFTVVNTT